MTRPGLSQSATQSATGMQHPEPSCHEASIQSLRTHWLQTGQSGQGESILFLHGWGGDSSVLWPLAATLGEAGFQVFALDLPGFGETAAPNEAWSVGDYARFVAEFLDQLALTRLHLVGHSFGGSVAMVLAAAQPDRIGKLALLSSAGIRRSPTGLVRWRTQAIRSTRGLLQRLGFANAAQTLSNWAAARFGSADYRAAQGVMRATLVRVLAEDLAETAANIQSPTLLLWGERDEATPRWQGELLARTIPDAGLHVFPGAGHYAFLERWSETGHILRYFFTEER
ncbi:MAG: alpha/beta fold hydrolase [Anaerolineaceae bacterium]|nr:alpha/beta fold hydrolase [Anaerolineaceae bacterium]